MDRHILKIPDLKRAILQSIFNLNKFNLSILHTNYAILAKNIYKM